MLCPRGTTPALDDIVITPMNLSLLKSKTWAPVVVDPSHSVGHSDYIKACSLASIAYGCDGLCIESHIDPSKGIGDDPKQAVKPEKIGEIIEAAKLLWSQDINPDADRVKIRNQVIGDIIFHCIIKIKKSGENPFLSAYQFWLQ